MKIVTFGGNFCYFPLMKYDIVYMDDDYVQCKEKVHDVPVVHVNSGVFDSGSYSRRYRIAFLLREIFKNTDDLLVVDSDVYIPKVNVHYATSFCIPAKAKPYDDIIVFCASTNFYLPSRRVNFAYHVMDEYIIHKRYNEYPVDIYLFSHISPLVKSVSGTYHYINGKKYYLANGGKILVE